jgi:hypothetical protein
MDSASFVEKHRLRVRRDPCGDPIALGKFGHLYEHAPGKFGIVLENPASGPSRAHTLLSRRRKALAAGFELHQAGDSEAIMLFDSENSAHVRLAIRLVAAKKRRQATATQLANLGKARQALKIAESLATEALQA